MTGHYNWKDDIRKSNENYLKKVRDRGMECEEEILAGIYDRLGRIAYTLELIGVITLIIGISIVFRR